VTPARWFLETPPRHSPAALSPEGGKVVRIRIHKVIHKAVLVSLLTLGLWAGQAQGQSNFAPVPEHAAPGASAPLRPFLVATPAEPTTVKTLPTSVLEPPPSAPAITDANVKPAACSSCGCTGPGDWSAMGCPSTGCGTCCVPGRLHCCSICEGDSCLKRFCCGLYCCICCPDPCYEPRWRPLPNAALFLDSPRPVTHVRFRYDGIFDIDRPDRAEYFMKQFANDKFINQASFNEFHLYNEIAPTPGFAFFIDLPFRSSAFEPAGLASTPADSSRFGDMSLGTKSVILDCELLLLTFQFTTYIPTGNPTAAGIGTGHVSLEPALLGALKLTPDLYAQFQTALWIPIAGGSDVAGSVVHNRLSLNYVLYRFLPDVQLIGTAEVLNYNVVYGGYTASLGNRVSDRGAFVNAGPGLRLNVCDRIDFGAGAHFSLVGDDFIGQQYRFEFRWRF
jgi:hypothetical protein